jgi:hypothetical protein
VPENKEPKPLEPDELSVPGLNEALDALCVSSAELLSALELTLLELEKRM